MEAPPSVFDVGDDGFAREVLEASHRAPVVVDFWAPWCGPCRTLGPLLERLAEQAAGTWRLAKVNVDESPQVASQLAVRSIPLVIGFRDGRAVSEFTGAQPESAVREFLEQVLPSQADLLAAEAGERLAAGDADEALAKAMAALQLDPRHGPAALVRAQVLAARGEVGEALSTLELLEGAPPELARAAERLAAEIRTGTPTAAGDADLVALRERVAADPRDLAARLALGRGLAAGREFEAALEQLLTVVEQDREYEEQAARKLMLDLFELLGGDHDLTQTFRGRLAQALFR